MGYTYRYFQPLFSNWIFDLYSNIKMNWYRNNDLHLVTLEKIRWPGKVAKFVAPNRFKTDIIVVIKHTNTHTHTGNPDVYTSILDIFTTGKCKLQVTF